MRKTIVLISSIFLSVSLWAQEGKKQLVFTATGLTEQAQKLLDKEDYDKAIEVCDQALEAASIYREAYIVKHKAYEGKGASSAKKIENLKAAQKISLEDEELAYYLGKIYQKGSRFDDAIAEYTKAIEYSPEDSEFRYFYFFSRGSSYVKKHKNEEALADFTEALKLRPESTSALVNRGFCYYNLKDNTKSCQDWRKASELGSKQVNQYLSQYCK
ncbi:MAG: tetratricopeptide repeat protein [Roseivirga sp.]|nr:tetratricopeptide repeat protein [Roseivirga sp.]